MNREALVFIADIYIPTIFFMAVNQSIFADKFFVIAHTTPKLRLLLLMSVLCSAFGLMVLDNTLSLWLKLSLDYSTHSAVALALILFLCISTPKFSIYFITSLLLYFWLMIIMQYHTVLDIVSTVLIIFPFSLGAFVGAAKISKRIDTAPK